MKLKDRITQVLEDQGGNYILPFFWQHGEEEAVLREYMKAIKESNIDEVCVESRPHPDFAGPGWWRDMDIILDEAVKRNMRVWILDDQHFPTGYAAGALINAESGYCHQYLDYNTLGSWGPRAGMEINVAACAKPQPAPPWMPPEPEGTRKFHDDHLFSVLACRILEGGVEGDTVDLTELVEDGRLVWDVPEGYWKIYVVYLTRDAKGRNDYINFLDRDSCRLLIDAVYEPHYKRYGKYFGNVIAGFFSDEPPIGNTPGYTAGDLIGKPDMPLSWSKEMEQAFTREYGDDIWKSHLNCLWSRDTDDHLTARMRTAYMNAVSRLVSECFSGQIGTWCEEHGTEYIGHMLEDCDSNANLGPSMGHFFRGLSGQHMAGIDNIGGQVVPGAQDVPRRLPQMCQDDAGFYHYMLGRMGASMAAIDPKKKGRCMCENFGAYGWRLGVRTEKYLMDHFLARGVNRYVPHAFSPKAFPDPDCPPHFYAHAKNPQYRAFGALMAYTNRICHLIDGGTDCAKVALLYHGESQWAGEYESNIHACRNLTENQVNFLLIPSDVFEEPETYNTSFDEKEKTLRINGTELKALVISGSQFITRAAAEFAIKAEQAGFPVIFTGRLPEGISDVKPDVSKAMTEKLAGYTSVPVQELAEQFAGFPFKTARTEEKSRYLTVYHYENGDDLYLLLNEDAGKEFKQWVTLPVQGRLSAYNAWDNQLMPVKMRQCAEGTEVYVKLAPLEMLILTTAEVRTAEIEDRMDKQDRTDKQDYIDMQVRTGMQERTETEAAAELEEPAWTASLTDFTVSRCEAEAYPEFYGAEEACLPEDMSGLHPEFSGFYRYETKITADHIRAAVLEIQDAYESAEVFVNGRSVGMRTAQPYLYELGDLDGEVNLAIEVATTLERKAAAIGADVSGMGMPAPLSPTGIRGKVMLHGIGMKRS